MWPRRVRIPIDEQDEEGFTNVRTDSPNPSFRCLGTCCTCWTCVFIRRFQMRDQYQLLDLFFSIWPQSLVVCGVFASCLYWVVNINSDRPFISMLSTPGMSSTTEQAQTCKTLKYLFGWLTRMATNVGRSSICLRSEFHKIWEILMVVDFTVQCISERLDLDQCYCPNLEIGSTNQTILRWLKPEWSSLFTWSSLPQKICYGRKSSRWAPANVSMGCSD